MVYQIHYILLYVNHFIKTWNFIAYQIHTLNFAPLRKNKKNVEIKLMQFLFCVIWKPCFRITVSQENWLYDTV